MDSNTADKKECLLCGKTFYRRNTMRDWMWEAKKYCSNSHRRKVGYRNRKEKAITETKDQVLAQIEDILHDFYKDFDMEVEDASEEIWKVFNSVFELKEK